MPFVSQCIQIVRIWCGFVAVICCFICVSECRCLLSNFQSARASHSVDLWIGCDFLSVVVVSEKGETMSSCNSRNKYVKTCLNFQVAVRARRAESDSSEITEAAVTTHDRLTARQPTKSCQIPMRSPSVRDLEIVEAWECRWYILCEHLVKGLISAIDRVQERKLNTERGT